MLHVCLCLTSDSLVLIHSFRTPRLLTFRLGSSSRQSSTFQSSNSSRIQTADTLCRRSVDSGAHAHGTAVCCCGRGDHSDFGACIRCVEDKMCGISTHTLSQCTAGTSTIIAYSMPCLLYLFASPTVLDEGGWRWTLRRSSKPVAGASFCIGGFLIVIFGFPQDLPITVRTFGWGPVAAIVSFAGSPFSLLCLNSAHALAVMLLTWILYGRSHYAGPIKSVLGPSIELPKQSSSTSSASKTEQTPSEMVGRTTRIEEPGNTTGGMTDATTTEWTEGTETGIGTLSYATEAQSRV